MCENKILNKYFDFENPGSFSGLNGLLKNNKKIDKVEAENA